MKPIIKVEDLSKQYRLGSIGTGTISNDLKRWWYNVQGKEDPFLKIGETNDRTKKGNSEYAWALKDINFEVMPGEVMGIIGKNGAGKSTLLKILSKVTGPTTGRIDYNGRIGSLLEVGTGFHPELTGRENIFLNGAILGMTKHEIRSKLDEIIDFSGCERYIDTPVKRYSSGMTVRLGFAVAAHLEPEILVVDEVLAVGDAEFQKKAIGKMQDVSRNDGRTVLFVSHNMDAIQRLCKTAVVLKNGQVEFRGEIEKAVEIYTKPLFLNNQTFWSQEIEEKKKESVFVVKNFALLKNDEVLNSNVLDEDEIYVSIDFELTEKANDITIGISLFDEKENYIYRTLHTDIDSNINLKQKLGNNNLKSKIETRYLKSGLYRVVLDISYHNIEWVVNPFEETQKVLTFNKDRSKSFSVMQNSTALISPRIEWLFNN